MAPGRPRKQKSSNSTMATNNAVAKSVTMKTPSPTRTPQRGQGRSRRPMISVAQKQALIDNLQLEVTERARKLRSVYALHAQGIRSRLEMRINRIPQGLRSVNIMELIDRYAEEPNARAKPLPKRILGEVARPVERLRTAAEPPSSPPRSRGTKRPSGDISTASSENKENIDVDLDLPKKRMKSTANATQAAVNGRSTRMASRKVVPSQVLSPKSNNSRPPPRSPAKIPISPPKAPSARPFSPLKSSASAPSLGERPKAPPGTTSRLAQTSRPTSAASGTTRGKRAVAGAAETKRGRVASNGSSASDVSAGTTIITRKAAPSTTVKKAAVDKKATATMTTATKKAAAAKKETVAPAPAASGGRSLRSRR